MHHDTTTRLNAIGKQREARTLYDRFSTIVSMWAVVCNALSFLTEMSTAGNHLLDPLIQTAEIRKDICRKMLKHLAIVIPFSYLAAQVGEAVHTFLCATLRSEMYPEFSSMDDNILDSLTMQRWHSLFHQILSEVCTQFRWATSSLEEAEADLIIANAGVRAELPLALGFDQSSDTELDSNDSGDT